MAARTPQEVAAVLAEWDATVNGRDVPKPVVDFTEAGLPPSFLQSIYAQNFVKPTAIQAVGWPSALSGICLRWIRFVVFSPLYLIEFAMLGYALAFFYEGIFAFAFCSDVFVRMLFLYFRDLGGWLAVFSITKVLSSPPPSQDVTW